jgi:hypothetical protein
MLGEAEDVDSAGGVLDAEQDVDPGQQHGVDVQVVEGEDAVGLGGEELCPGRPASSRGRVQAGFDQDVRTVLGETWYPRPSSSPTMRW